MRLPFRDACTRYRRPAALRSTFTPESALLTAGASTTIGSPSAAAYADNTVGGLVAAVKSATDAYQPNSHARGIDSPDPTCGTGWPPNACRLRTWPVCSRTRGPLWWAALGPRTFGGVLAQPCFALPGGGMVAV
ncbi:hypothetical protein AB0D27_39150 [Streptomyces sp. NPDC048415]|uniref:hypothetical protein n=1 Tax=Streptomyces sp. NPDC048415 TaxID=3154822 RepID=UPI00342D4A67